MDREICVSLQGKQPIYFVIQDNILPFDNLRLYYSNAGGLQYQANNIIHSVKVVDNNLLIPSNVSDFRLFTNEATELNSITDIIIKYFHRKYTYKEICSLLEIKHGFKISSRSLRRRLKKLNLKRKKIVESRKEDIIAAIIHEINDTGINLGYKSLHQRLKSKYRLAVKQSTVLKLLRLVDSKGVEGRKRHRLKRRLYKVPGPNHLWHLEGYDKLKKYGFAVHGCVDGFSRKVMWLHVSTTNNNPKVVAYYYLKCLKCIHILPSVIRSDRGTENTVIDKLQMALRHHHTDKHAGIKSFVKGKSTANERIEKYWKQLRNHTAEFYISIFKVMQDKNILDIGNKVHIEVLRFCFAKLIDASLKTAQKDWNEHRISKQKRLGLPCGIPNVMYYWPNKYNAKDCSKKVDEKNIDILLNKFAEEPVFYNSSVENMIKILTPNVKSPKNHEEAYNLFVKIINLMNS